MRLVNSSMFVIDSIKTDAQIGVRKLDMRMQSSQEHDVQSSASGIAYELA